jgi:cytochrome P450
MSPIPTPNIASPPFKANPYPYYARLRNDAPVHAITLPGRRRAWLITRYDDVLQALKDERFVKDQRNVRTENGRHSLPWMPGFLEPLTRNMLDQDGADHARLRALVHKAFTPRMIERMRDRIETLCNDLLDAAQRRGRLELVADYALPLPVTIIADMLGVPATDRGNFHRWSQGIVSITSGRDLLAALPALMLFMRYIKRLIARRRAAPQDDLLTALVQAEEAGDHLSEDELLAMIFLLLVAGHETTVNLISSGTLALLQHPEQLARLRAEPALIGSAVEELLRFCSPVEIATDRFAREDVTVANVTIPAGAFVLAVLGSANHDERQFAAPDTLDLARTPNRHLGLGQGIHYCLGAPLARLETQIALSTLLDRFPALSLAQQPDALRWRRGIFLRGLRQLPLRFAPRSATRSVALGA